MLQLSEIEVGRALLWEVATTKEGKWHINFRKLFEQAAAEQFICIDITELKSAELAREVPPRGWQEPAAEGVE
eukprot:920522-Heterocapsa_arctica.AAC.1